MITVWHNPKCAKSREAVKMVEEKGEEVTVVKYMDELKTRDEIKSMLKLLGVSARELMRTKEDIYKELGLAKESDESKLIDAMAAHPKLIERPILIEGNKAIIGRPIEKVIEFLKHI